MIVSSSAIKQRRRDLGLTQEELSRLAGVSQSLIAKLESGEVRPNYENVKNILDAMDKLEAEATRDKVSKILSNAKPERVQKGQSVSEAANLMRKGEYSQLPVFDGEKSIGSVSEKTIQRQIEAGRDPAELSKAHVEEIMDEEFPQVSKDSPLITVLRLLGYYQAVLVRDKGIVIGIVTKADLLRLLR